MKFIPEIIDGKKNCVGCGHFLSLDMFWKMGKYYLKLCKECTREKLKLKEGYKTCRKCGEEKEYRHFSIAKNSHSYQCNDCKNGYQKNRYDTDDDYRKSRNEYTNNYRENNKDYRQDHKGQCSVYYKKYAKNNVEKNRDRSRKISADNVRSLSDNYIKNLVTKHNKGIEYVPPQLIKLKRILIKSKRQLKIIENESRTTT